MQCASELERVGCCERGAPGHRVPVVPGRKAPRPSSRVGGLILIDQPANTVPAGVSVVYARVSSGDQRQDLERQVARVATWATGRNLFVDRIVTEVGSALSRRRRKLLTLLRDPDVTTIAVEHRDRFARFGAEY